MCLSSRSKLNAPQGRNKIGFHPQPMKAGEQGESLNTINELYQRKVQLQTQILLLKGLLPSFKHACSDASVE